jgi:alkylation response protein AidB-like acyl-CoA dehydrogenase
MDFEFSDEQTELRRTVRDIAEAEFGPTAFAAERPQDFVRDRARRLCELGFTGITFPAQDGGQGGQLLDAVIVLSEIARVCPHTGDVVQAYNFGGIRQLQELASPALKRQWLAPALRGEILISLAMSEPDAGSGLASIRTTADARDDRAVINGSKIFATHGVDADLIIVWCRFGTDPQAIGAVAVPATAPGFTRGATETFMSGERYCQMYFDNCTVPADNVLIDSGGIRRLMPVFNIERLGNATRALALATAAFDMAVAHARSRRAGETLIKDLQGMQWKFADMKLQLEAARLLLFRAATMRGGPTDEATALAKCFANEAAFFVANQSLQVLGGYGYSTEFPLEYILRRVRGWMIAGGTTEILRNRIARNIFKADASARR